MKLFLCIAIILLSLAIDKGPAKANGSVQASELDRKIRESSIQPMFRQLNIAISQLNMYSKKWNKNQEFLNRNFGKIFLRVQRINYLKYNLEAEWLTKNEKKQLAESIAKLRKGAKEFRIANSTQFNELRKARLIHGQDQINAMLKSHPKMQKFVSKDDQLWEWTIGQFAGQSIDTEIYWSSSPSRSVSEHFLCPTDKIDRPVGLIRINPTVGDVALNGEELWSMAVYEFMNIRRARDLNRVLELAVNTDMSEQSFVESITRLEYLAVKKTAVFYRTVWKQHCLYKGLPSNERYWGVDEPNTYEEWIKKFKGSNYLANYCNTYRTYILPKRKLKTKKEKEFARESSTN